MRNEASRREAEEERRQRIIELEQAERRRPNTKLAHALQRQAGAWFLARVLRRYVSALRRATSRQPSQGNLPGRSIDFLRWADRYIEQLDPLSPTPHDPDLIEERPSYQRTGESTLEALTRLLGQEWHEAWKPAHHAEDVAGDGAEEDESFA